MLKRALGNTFIGQSQLITELGFMAESVLAGENINLLFEAPSGYGKTTLAKEFIAVLDPEYQSSFKYRISKSGINFQNQARFHLIDEVHTLRTPETLYEPLSSGEYTILLATNEFDELAEPLRNRCMRLTFDDYTKEELARIAYLQFVEKDMRDVPPDWCLALAEYSRGVPRVVKELAVRISIIVRYGNYSFDNTSIHDLMFGILGTERGGITKRDRQYLEALQQLGGVASFARVQALSNIPSRTIEEEIEPFLIRKGLILITSKGRSLTNV